MKSFAAGTCAFLSDAGTSVRASTAERHRGLQFALTALHRYARIETSNFELSSRCNMGLRSPRALHTTACDCGNIKNLGISQAVERDGPCRPRIRFGT